MTDYSKMSDAEINIGIAKIQYPKSGWNTPYSHRPDVHIYHNNGTVEVKDYINNPADAWPIINENMICINYHSGRGVHVHGYGDGGIYDSYFPYKMVLRGCMEIYLMMKESENA